jgi:hypothetical protein
MYQRLHANPITLLDVDVDCREGEGEGGWLSIYHKILFFNVDIAISWLLTRTRSYYE